MPFPSSGLHQAGSRNHSCQPCVSQLNAPSVHRPRSSRVGITSAHKPGASQGSKKRRLKGKMQEPERKARTMVVISRVCAFARSCRCR